MAESSRGRAFLPLPVHYRGIPDPVQNRIKEGTFWPLRYVEDFPSRSRRPDNRDVTFMTETFFVKSIHFGHVHSQLFAPVNTRVQWKVLALSYYAIVIFEQLIICSKGLFSRQCISQNHGDYWCFEEECT